MEKRKDNRKNIKFRIKIAAILLFLAIVTGLNVYFGISHVKFEKYILTKDVMVEHNGKRVFDGNIDNYKLENVKAQDIYTIYMKVPKNNIINPAVQYDNINTAVKIYIDGKKVYSIGDNVKKGGVVCHMHNKAPLGDIKSGQEIKMVIRVMDKSGLTRLPRVKLMNTRDIDKEFFVNNADNIIYSCFLLIFGIVGVAVVVCNGKLDLINKKILILSLLSLSSCISIISTYQLFQIVSDNAMLDMYCEYVNRYVVLFLASLYMYVNVNEAKRKRNFKVLSIIIAVNGIVAIALQSLKIMYVNDTLWLSCLLMVVLIYNIVKSIWKNMKREVRIRVLVVFEIIASALVLATLFLYVFFTQWSADLFMYFPDVQVIFISIMFIELIYGLAQNYKNDAEKQALKDLAYMDKLTGLGNRRGMELYLKRYIRKNRVYKVYSFELNGLKNVNDTYGHATGDKIIKIFADELDNIFSEGFCARMGGNEFVAIVENTSKNKGLLEKLRKFIYLKNTKGDLEYKINFVVGSSIYNPNKESIEDVIKEADAKMYKMKEQIKNIS